MFATSGASQDRDVSPRRSLYSTICTSLPSLILLHEHGRPDVFRRLNTDRPPRSILNIEVAHVLESQEFPFLAQEFSDAVAGVLVMNTAYSVTAK